MNSRTLAILAASAAGLCAAPAAHAGLIGLYAFDDAADNFKDSSPAGNHITDTGGTVPVWENNSGFNGSGAYTFIADRLVVPTDINPAVMPKMTWGAWVRTNNLAPAPLHKVLGHDNGGYDRTIGLDTRPTGIFRYTSFTGNGLVAGTPGPENTTDWAFIAASYDQAGNTVTMYVDIDASTSADPLVSVTQAGSFGAGETGFGIGGLSPANANEAWDGAIDQVFLYDEVLSPKKVELIRRRGLDELKGIYTTQRIEVAHDTPLFGQITVPPAPGTISRSITIKNAATAGNLVLSAPGFTGTNAGSFSTGALPGPIAPGAQATLTVSLTHPGNGSFTATLQINSNDPEFPAVQIPLDAAVVNTTSNLIGLYAFDDAANPLKDTSGYFKHITGTASTNPVWGATAGFNGSGAYDFTGDRLIVPIDVNPSVLPQMTWGAWVRTTNLSSGYYKVLGSDNGGYDRVIGLDPRGGGFHYATFTGFGVQAGTPAPVSTSQWSFIAAVYDQTTATATMYVDLDASTTADALQSATESTNFNGNWTTFAIGGVSPAHAGEPWPGAIDNVFVYKEALTSEKLTAIRNRGLRELQGIPAGDPDITLAPANLFGDLTGLGAGPGPVTRPITITNTGASLNLAVSAITIIGPDAARYSVTPPLPAPIPPGGSADVNIVLTPLPAGGSYTATLRIASNDEDTPLATAGLNATVATDPDIRVTAPSPLFGRMTFNTEPPLITRKFTVRNAGVAASLTVNAPVITGPDAPRYSVVSFPATLAPGAQGDVVIGLNPAAASTFTASLQLTSSDPDTPASNISLNGSIVIVAPAALKAFYSFNSEANSFKDDSGNGNDITDTAGTDPLWGATTGLGGTGAYEFLDDRLISPIDANPASMPQMTWGAWVRTNTLTDGYYKVLGLDNGGYDRVIGLDVRPAGFHYASFTGDYVQAGTPGPVSTTDWTFLAATYDEAALTVTMYVDLDASTTGDRPVSVTEPTGFDPGASTFAIGGLRPDNANEPWNGAIDNVFIYDGILTDEQIIKLRDTGLPDGIGAASDFAVTGITVNANRTVTLTWVSAPGAFYTVYYSTDLATPISSWADDSDSVASQGASTTYTTTTAFTGNSRVFFAIKKN